MTTNQFNQVNDESEAFLAGPAHAAAHDFNAAMVLKTCVCAGVYTVQCQPHCLKHLAQTSDECTLWVGVFFTAGTTFSALSETPCFN